LKVMAIGDLHLSGSSDKPMDVFGPHWRDHDSRIAGNWTAAVGPEDLVLVPGDISWAMDWAEAVPDLEWLHRLPGRKIIIKGNHDYWWPSISRLRGMLPSSISALQYDGIAAGQYAVAGTRGWKVPGSEGYREEKDGRVYRRELQRLKMSLASAGKLMPDGGMLICMMHYPPVIDGRETEFSRIMAEAGVHVCVYGHLHSSSGDWGEAVNTELGGVEYYLVSADHLNFSPKLIMGDCDAG